MKAWRLLGLETCNAFMNMAIDEAILRARTRNIVSNTLRLYRWSPSAVSIGKSQVANREVQLENCERCGVDVVRRITGGGTVYHDAEDEVTYGVIASKGDMGTEDIAVIYSKVYSGLVEALGILGLKTDFSEGNAKACPNLTISGRKVSGSAQAHKKGVVLQHGTLLLDIDLEKMFSLLRVPWAETCMQVANIAKGKITSLRNELGRQVSAEEAAQALVNGFEKALGIDLTDSKLTAYEQELANRLCREKYSERRWNLMGESVREDR